MFHFLIETDQKCFIIILESTIFFHLNVNVSTANPPLRSLEERYNLTAAEASSNPIGKLTSMDRWWEQQSDGFGLLRQLGDNPFDVLSGRYNRGVFKRGPLSNVQSEIFSKFLHFLMSALQVASKFLIASDDLKIIEKSWDILDLVLKADIILGGSLNA